MSSVRGLSEFLRLPFRFGYALHVFESPVHWTTLA